MNDPKGKTFKQFQIVHFMSTISKLLRNLLKKYCIKHEQHHQLGFMMQI